MNHIKPFPPKRPTPNPRKRPIPIANPPPPAVSVNPFFPPHMPFPLRNPFPAPQFRHLRDRWLRSPLRGPRSTPLTGLYLVQSLVMNTKQEAS